MCERDTATVPTGRRSSGQACTIVEHFMSIVQVFISYFSTLHFLFPFLTTLM